jgi:hypothetical protein
LLWIFFTVQVAWFVMAWLLPAPLHLGSVVMRVTADATGTAGATLPPLAAASGALLELPVLVLLAYALWRLDRLLRAYGRGRIFELGSIAHLRAFAGCLLLALGMGFLEPVARALVWRHALHLPDVAVTVGVTSEQLGIVLLCAVFYVIAATMHEGRRLAEENEGFV